jgi:hypothetical protein
MHLLSNVGKDLLNVHWMYPFEREFGRLAACIHSMKNVELTAVRHYRILEATEFRLVPPIAAMRLPCFEKATALDATQVCDLFITLMRLL